MVAFTLIFVSVSKLTFDLIDADFVNLEESNWKWGKFDKYAIYFLIANGIKLILSVCNFLITFRVYGMSAKQPSLLKIQIKKNNTLPSSMLVFSQQTINFK